jgi:cysteinyl-tRNA synthetase
LVREANIAMDKDDFRRDDVAVVQEFLAAFDSVFAVLQDNDAERLKAVGYGGAANDFSDEEVEKLVQERQAARLRRDFAASDRLRQELADRGILLEDIRDGGVRWKRK